MIAACSSLLERALRFAAVLLLMALLGAVVTGVISRQLNRPVIWSDEMAQYLLVWTGFVGWMIAALNGANYAFFKRHDDRAGLLMSAVAGLVAFVMWFIVMEIIGGDFGLSYGLNVFKAIVTGIIAGIIGFGWFAIMRKLPDKLIP